MRAFDVTHHQPHPPGYPLFILAAKGMRLVMPSEARALAIISVVSAALGVLAMGALFQQLSGGGADTGPLIALLIATTAPLYWFTAARPLSDSLGLAAAIGAQTLILRARSHRALAIAAFCAGLAIGVRSQVLWLTLPLLIVALVLTLAGLKPRATTDVALEPRATTDVALEPRVTTDGARGFSGTNPAWRFSPAIGAAAAWLTGVLLWFVPLVVVSGGPGAYSHALFDQGVEDLSGIRMLWTTPTPRAFVDALYYAFVAPWASWLLAAVVLGFAAAGAALAVLRDRRSFALVAAAFGPYLIFDVLFQETFTSRYALPLVVPIAWLAAKGLRVLPSPVALVAVVPIAMYGAHIGGRSIAAYSREPAPVFRLLDQMRAASAASATKPVLAPDRRLSFDLRRPVAWMGASAPAVERQLPSPPQHEWLEAAKYWNAGGSAPVWFVVDPRRAAIDLVQHGDPVSFQYALPFPVLMSGTRPGDANWYRVEQPEWYVGNGWALTPEAAGISEAEKGTLDAVTKGWVRGDLPGGSALVFGGRNFDPAKPVRLRAVLGGQSIIDRPIDPGPFLQVVRLPPAAPAASRYVELLVSTAAPAGTIGLEQFDISRSRAVLGFGPGWHEREFNPATGRLWRWVSDRGELRYVTNGLPVKLRISGESPRPYYSKASRLIVRAGARVLADAPIADDFTVEFDVPPALDPSTLVVETDQTHVPAERSWRGATDRRRLGLRIYSCALVPATASLPGTGVSFPPAR